MSVHWTLFIFQEMLAKSEQIIKKKEVIQISDQKDQYKIVLEVDTSQVDAAIIKLEKLIDLSKEANTSGVLTSEVLEVIDQ